MKKYTEKQVERLVRDAITRTVINEAVAVSRWCGSTRDAAEQMLRGANIKRAEIRRCISDPADRRRVMAYLG